MKKIINSLLFLLIAFSVIAQYQQPALHQELRAIVTVESSMNIGNSNQYDILVKDFLDTDNQFYRYYQVQPGMWIWTDAVLPEYCNRFKILAVSEPTAGKLLLRVENPDRTGFNGNAQVGTGVPIFQHTECRDYPLFVASQPSLDGYTNPKIQSCIETHARIALDKDICLALEGRGARDTIVNINPTDPTDPTTVVGALPSPCPVGGLAWHGGTATNPYYVWEVYEDALGNCAVLTLKSPMDAAPSNSVMQVCGTPTGTPTGMDFVIDTCATPANLYVSDTINNGFVLLTPPPYSYYFVGPNGVVQQVMNGDTVTIECCTPQAMASVAIICPDTTHYLSTDGSGNLTCVPLPSCSPDKFVHKLPYDDGTTDWVCDYLIEVDCDGDTTYLGAPSTCIAICPANTTNCVINGPCVTTTNLDGTYDANCNCIANSTGSACNDGIQNGNETDIDCGGSCPPCVSDLQITITAN